MALTAIQLQQLGFAESGQNQHNRPIPAGVLVRGLMMNSLNRGILKPPLHPQKQTLKAFHAKYNRQNLNAKPAQTRRASLALSNLHRLF
ncbi:MAG: hypothetical protein WCI18_04720 [Pseudomonadota bacterium]